MKAYEDDRRNTFEETSRKANDLEKVRTEAEKETRDTEAKEIVFREQESNRDSSCCHII